MGFYSKGLSRRSAIALAAGLATGVLPDWGGIAQAVAPFPAKFKNEGKHGGEHVSATEDLMRQHSLLRRILNVCSELAQRLQRNEGDIDTIALEKAAKLFHDFGEDYHELLEEAYIFPEMSSAGGPNRKMVEVLLLQHQRGREITDYLYQVGSRGTIAGEAEPLAKALASMARMYSAHAAWEDTVIFPIWESIQSNERLEDLARKFEDIEHEKFGKDGFQDAVAGISKIEQALGLSDLAAFTAPPPPTA
jgi:hemerythrin-like domain-containing protein